MHGAPVFTEQGLSVGKLASVDFEADTGKLTAIHVSHHGIISGLLSDELVVPWSSIVEIKKDQVIILDTAIPSEARSIAKQPAANPNPLLKEQAS